MGVPGRHIGSVFDKRPTRCSRFSNGEAVGTIKGESRKCPTENTVIADTASEPTVLLVEDERHLADLYAEYLADSYRVLTAYSGEEGLDRLSDEVDVVIIDRRMPVTSGNEVLAAIDDTEIRCRVAMITDSGPDGDVTERGYDDYLVKPVTRDDILEVTDRLIAVTRYTDALGELARKKLDRNVLDVETNRSDPSENDRFRDLEAEIERLQSIVDELETRFELEELDLRL